jgi:hypothetical protein
VKERLDNTYTLKFKKTKKEVEEAVEFVSAFVKKQIQIVKEKEEKGIVETHPTVISLLYKASIAENATLTHQDILDETIFIMEAGNNARSC